jgi:hypothetical protein
MYEQRVNLLQNTSHITERNCWHLFLYDFLGFGGNKGKSWKTEARIFDPRTGIQNRDSLNTREH